MSAYDHGARDHGGHLDAAFVGGLVKVILAFFDTAVEFVSKILLAHGANLDEAVHPAAMETHRHITDEICSGIDGGRFLERSRAKFWSL